MFADEVFVFTPRGDVINLPAGATPIDFAYNIHSAVGNHMVAAKVNGRIVPFDCRLKNGDIVEVVTSQSAHGPSRDWVKIARSSNARSKIRQWLKRERRDENVVTGRASFESELKRCGVSLKELTNDENLPGILKKLTYKSLDDLYAAIGYGGHQQPEGHRPHPGGYPAHSPPAPGGAPGGGRRWKAAPMPPAPPCPSAPTAKRASLWRASATAW